MESTTCYDFRSTCKNEGLRNLIVALKAHWRKLYHLGMSKSVTRSNLVKANEQRDYRIFEDIAYHFVAEARFKSTERIFGLDGHVYTFDSTTIDLCFEVLSERNFESTKVGSRFIHSMILKHKFLFNKSNINNINERFGSSEPSLFNF